MRFSDYYILESVVDTLGVNGTQIEDIIKGLERYYDVSVGKQNSNKMKSIIVKTSDRDGTKEEIEKDILSDFKPKSKDFPGSGFPGTEVLTDDGPTLRIFYKPKSGGMNETTINSTATELIPCIAFEKKIRTSDVDELYRRVMDQDFNKLKCFVDDRDALAGRTLLTDFENSTKYNEKLNNAIGVIKYLDDLNKQKKIKQTYWTYRGKPEGVPADSPADIVVKFRDDELLGVSLKAGGAKTKEPLLNTYVKPIFEFFGKENDLVKLENKLWNKVYSKIDIEPDGKTPDFDREYSSRINKRDTLQKLARFEKENPEEYNRFYDMSLTIIRDALIKLFNSEQEILEDFISQKILKETGIPVVIVKAVGDDYHLVESSNKLGELMSLTTKITARKSKSSKQNFFLDIEDGEGNTEALFSVRTNKSGIEHKLGQFYNLAVKFSGLKD